MSRLDLGHGHAADADALHAQYLEIDTVAHEHDLSGQRVLQGEAQAGFVLPADLARGQGPVAEAEAMGEALHAIGCQFATDFDEVFLFEGGAAILEVGHDAAVLADDDQAAVFVGQGHDQLQGVEMALEEGDAQDVAGGEVTDGVVSQAFYCAAILGSPALWAPAREAMRTGKIKLAWQYGRRALKRAFSGRLRFTLDGGEKRRTEALVLISPMISKALEGSEGLEAAAMDPTHAADAFRLAAHALFDDWRLPLSAELKKRMKADVARPRERGAKHWDAQWHQPIKSKALQRSRQTRAHTNPRL